MLRHLLLATAATAVLAFGSSAQAQISNGASGSVETVVVTAQKLAEARNGIETQLGASTYTVTAKDIDNAPGGQNTLLNQVILQAPGAAQDSFGQLHIRGEHNGLQYRLNGIIIPEGISVFGQTLDPRLANAVKLITGALPAEYGNRTAGVIDVQTKTGQRYNNEYCIVFKFRGDEIAELVEYCDTDLIERVLGNYDDAVRPMAAL